MNKKTSIITIAITTIVILFSLTAYSKAKIGKSELILFQGRGCPHCANVDRFIEENNIAKKVSFSTKEIYYNKDNLNDLIKKAKKCGVIEDGRVPIPFLWEGNNKCIHGDKTIIKYFKEATKKK